MGKTSCSTGYGFLFQARTCEEEIERLNVEIRRVITHMRDEDKFLRYKESVVQQTDSSLAHQIHILRMEKGRFVEVHRHWFSQLPCLPGFTGNLSYRFSIDRTLHQVSENDMEVDGGEAEEAFLGSDVGGGDDGADEEDGIDEDQENEDLIEKFNVLAVTMDEHRDGGFGFS